MNSKPYSGKTAVVYDRDITGLGGGDREALAFAKMLTSYGFSTQVVTNVLPIPSEERIATAFGDEFEGVVIKHVEISEMAKVNGSMRRRSLSTLVVPAEGRVEFKPCQLHLLLKQRKKNLPAGEKVDLIFTFRSGARQTVTVSVINL